MRYLKRLLLAFAIILVFVLALSGCDLIDKITGSKTDFNPPKQNAETVKDKDETDRPAGQTESEESTEHQHTLVFVNSKEATCQSAGNTEGILCSVCGEWIEEAVEIPPTGHIDLEVIEAVPPTCSENGWTEGTRCKLCHTVVDQPQEIAKLDHPELAAIPAVEATCGEYGWTEGKKCALCGVVVEKPEQVPKLPHGEPEVIPAVPATCTSAGFTQGTRCSVCKQTIAEPEQTEMLPHTPKVTKQAKAATCSSTGYTAEEQCTVCGKVLKASQTTSKLAHTPVTDIAYLAPTCQSEGHTAGTKCSVCGTRINTSTVLAKTDHQIGKDRICVYCKTGFYENGSLFFGDCVNTGSDWTYNGAATALDLQLDNTYNGKTVLIPNSVTTLTVHGKSSTTYTNLSFQLNGASVKYVFFENVTIQSSKSVLKTGGTTYLYMIGAANRFTITGKGATGATGHTGDFNGGNGGTGGIGVPCFDIPVCYLYTYSTTLNVKAGTGGTGGQGGTGWGIFSTDGSGGNGGRGGYAFSGSLMVNKTDNLDLYSAGLGAKGSYSISGGDGGAGGARGNGLGKKGSNGSSGSVGAVSINNPQSALNG